MAGNLAEAALTSLLVVGGQFTQRVNEICERHGITHSQYNVLRILAGSPDGHARCDIAKRLADRAPDVTRLVDRLERSGYVERTWSTENRRHSIARLTPAGAALLETMKPDMCAMHQAVATALSPADLEALVRIGQQLAADS